MWPVAGSDRVRGTRGSSDFADDVACSAVVHVVKDVAVPFEAFKRCVTQ